MRNELRFATLVIAAVLAVGCKKPDQAAQGGATPAAAVQVVPVNQVRRSLSCLAAQICTS